ncbi:MAG: DUF4886 domain-containing protein [Ruminococcaceae bacterium]|nr:DUF4886 domain-containing protein [Oscillospiraceae bacterium]
MKQTFLRLFFAPILLLSSLLSACSPALETPPSKQAITATETATQTTEKKEPEIIQKSDPKADDTVNVLMIGNSGCYYYVEELYGIAKAAGIKMKVCNLYYSGCPLEKHWTWWKLNEKKYQYFETDENGRIGYSNYSLNMALQSENWDMISLQEAFSPNKAKDRELCFSNCEPYMKDLTAYLREQFPQSKLFWHQTWSYEVGYNRDNGVIDSPEAQEAHHQTVRDVSLHLCKTYDLQRIPVGDAWQIARRDPVIGDRLCHKKGAVGDFLHDGDTGGGQYLNGCVWFEVLTGQSCIGNTWRPDYVLSEEMIAALQQDAHRAVEEMRSEAV